MKAISTLLGAIMAQRQVYDTWKAHGDDAAISGLSKHLLQAIDSYYETDRGIQQCDRELIVERIIRGLPNPKHQTAFREFMRGVPEDPSCDNVIRDIQEIKKERIQGELSLQLANRGPQDTIDSLIAEYRSISDGHATDEAGSASELIDLATHILNPPEEDKKQRIKLLPTALNEAVSGRCGKGNHILIFAYTNTGKTTFTVNMVAGFVQQGLRTLYVFNEEPVMEKIAGRLLKVDPNEVASLPEERKAKLASIKDKIILAKLDSFVAVRKILDSAEVPYDVVVLDQLRNMRVKSESRTIELEAAGIEARAIGREHNVLVVSVTQGTANAETKVYLEKSDVDSSKVGIPGAMDLMIGLGADPAMRANGLLGVSICKSKFGPDARFTVTANFSTSVIQ